jgi:hypothetical protein
MEEPTLAEGFTQVDHIDAFAGGSFMSGSTEGRNKEKRFTELELLNMYL